MAYKPLITKQLPELFKQPKNIIFLFSKLIPLLKIIQTKHMQFNFKKNKKKLGGGGIC